VSLCGITETAETETARHVTAGRETHHCAECSKAFTPVRADARYCSAKCRLKGHRAKARATDDRSINADKPKRPCPPTPVAEKPYVDPDRPALYTEEIAAEICDRLAHGETLVKICRSEHIPSRTTVLRWVQENRQNFGDRFARARDLQFEHWADNLADVADAVRDKPEQVPAARLDSENKRWLLARLKPSLYSEKFQADITSAGKPLASASDLDVAKALAHALQALPAPVIDAEAVEVKPEGEQP
jgi:hypothetical protein